MKNSYGLTPDEMYELLNKPFLQEVVDKNLPVKFTVDPRKAGGALQSEFEFLDSIGYIFDVKALTMVPGK